MEWSVQALALNTYRVLPLFTINLDRKLDFRMRTVGMPTNLQNKRTFFVGGATCIAYTSQNTESPSNSYIVISVRPFSDEK